VLLVDDEEPVLRLAERMLRRHGWQVLAATSGEAALALLTSHQHLDSADNPQRGAHAAISAVITDMVMPGMDGVALVRAVRRRLDDPELPAILVSGYAEETLRRDFESANTHFLAKPYTLKALVALLETATRPIGDAAIAD
jgi:two-component system cell cycle sensor histidine kinase/response regulator CckA